MNYKFSPEAEIELDDAYNWYDAQCEGLGHLFVHSIKTSIEIILRHPDCWPLVGKYTRRCLITKFPYLLLYTYENNEVYITCIGHQHRNPDFYKDKYV